MSLVCLIGEDCLGARDLHPLQVWLGCSVISQLELEGRAQHLGERRHFPSFERVN